MNINNIEQNIEQESKQEMLITNVCFPSNVYTIKATDFLNDALDVFNENITKVTNHTNELYPVKMTGHLYNDVRVKNLCLQILNTSWDILESQGFKMDDKVTTLMEFWGQEHHKHSAMEEHVHPYGAQIVGFYFLDVPENSSKVVVHDPRAGKVMSHMPEINDKNVTSASNMINFDIETGILFFSNSWLPHSFTRHGSDKPLKFIHFNVGVRMNENIAINCNTQPEII